MKSILKLVIFFTLGLLFQDCKKDPFPVPPASTVPQFTFTINNKGYAPATATFTNTSIVPSTVGDAYYSWDFGDGSSSHETNPDHVYTNPGVFVVKLTIKTSISQEIVTSTQEISLLNAAASGIIAFFTDGSTVYSGFLNDDKPVFSALPIGPFDDAYGMALDTVNNKLYISDSGTGIIYRCDPDGSNLTEFRKGISGPDGLAIDYVNGKLYWDTDNSIQRTNLSSTTSSDFEDFVTGIDNDPEGVSIDATNGKLYWINYNGGLWSVKLDGTQKTELIATPEGGATRVVQNRVFFDLYNGSGDIHLKSSNLDGTGVSTITTGISKIVFALAYETKTNKIYWGNRSVGKIMRANLDGSNIETWYEKAGSNPRGLVFGKKQ